jgi:hypothetical protein
MRVCIYTGNHGNAVGLSDLVRLLKNSIADCGWDVCVSHELMRGCCNILIEHFVEEPILRHVLESKTPGTRYVLIGTELITGKTFNRGLVQQHWHYGNDPYWQSRYEGFMFVARMADVVWVLGEPALAPYRATLPDKPVQFMPHGWVSDFELVRHRPEDEKDIDFYFSGTLTAYRREILESLVRRGHRVTYNVQSTPDYLRLDQLGRTKVCLSLPLSPDNDLPSISRMHFHLQNRNFLIQEQYSGSCWLDPYVMHASRAEVLEWASAALEIPNRREIADGVWHRFKTEMPMTRWMQPLMAEAIGQATPRAREAIRQVA